MSGHSWCKSVVAPSSALSLDDFQQDAPYTVRQVNETLAPNCRMIEGVTVTSLKTNSDTRGSLVELLTIRDAPIDPIVHAYKVTALPRSIRAWNYHRWQDEIGRPQRLSGERLYATRKHNCADL
jgi:hypothetical protein